MVHKYRNICVEKKKNKEKKLKMASDNYMLDKQEGNHIKASRKDWATIFP